MRPLTGDEQEKLMGQITKDLKAATGMAHAGAKNACVNLKAGRHDDALHALLEIEPKLYDAKKLFVLATYVNGLGKYKKENK